MNGAETLRLDRITAGEALDRVIRILTGRRPSDDILAEVLAQTRAMLDAAETYLLLKHGDQLVIRASHGLIIGPNGRRQFPVATGLEGIAAQLGEPVIAVDLRDDPRHHDPFDRPHPIGSLLAVPLILRGVTLGVMASTRRTAGRFATVEMWWMEVFGGLVANLIASDSAYQAQERRARQAEALLALSTGEEFLGVTANTVAEIAHALGYDRCGVLLGDGHSPHYEHTAFTGHDHEAGQLPPIDLRACGYLAEVLQSERTTARPDIQGDPCLSQVTFLQGIHGFLAAPIRVSGAVRGIIYAGAATPGWIEGDEAFLELVAARIGLMLERSELRERQHEIERQQVQMEARQEFLGIVSHELKTPVAVMKAYTEVLLRRAERNRRESEIDVLTRMSDQAERMLAMIEQLLDLRRIEAGLLSLEVSHLDLSELVRRLAHEVELANGSHRITVETPGRIQVNADRRRLEEVVTNLLDNAVKYSPADGEIQVRITRADAGTPRESALVTVHDEGPGISASDRDRVFERFFQASGRLHKGRTGLGLGLHISRELARRHGGDLWLAAHEGPGATFHLRLPVHGPPDAE